LPICSRVAAEFIALSIGQKGCGRAFHHFLVAALHGAVALEEMHQVAVRVAQDLHFDVPCLAHEFLEIDLVIAEAGLGLAARHRQQLRQLRVTLDDAHAAAATAPARLQHHRIADLGRLLLAGFDIGGQRRRRRHHRHARRSS
jgi:hypothetical protein